MTWWQHISICGALRNLVPFVQFKKRENQLWRSVNFSKVAGFSLQLKLTLLHGCFHVFKIVQLVPNRATHHILKVSLSSMDTIILLQHNLITVNSARWSFEKCYLTCVYFRKSWLTVAVLDVSFEMCTLNIQQEHFIGLEKPTLCLLKLWRAAGQQPKWCVFDRKSCESFALNNRSHHSVWIL